MTWKIVSMFYLVKNLERSSSNVLATSIIEILSKLLCFAVEAKKIAIHHRTPIFSPLSEMGLMDLSSLKRPSVHKSITKIKISLMRFIDQNIRTTFKSLEPIFR